MASFYSKNQLIFSKKNAISKFYPDNKEKFISKIIIILLEFYFKLKVNFLNLIKKILIKINNQNKLKDFQKITFDNIKVNFNKMASESLNKNSWCFIENFLDDHTFNLIKCTWPNKENFFLSNKTIKHYFMKKIIYKIDDLPKKDLNNIDVFTKYIYSQKFNKIINDFCKTSNFKIKNVVASISEKNSYLIPHVDNVIKDGHNKTYNLIFFIDGNNKNYEFSGATGIFEDNEFENPIFIPKNLINTCLIYNSSNKFYHGFKKMKEDCFRKAITISLMEQ